MKKRILSLLLAIVMVLGMMPVFAMAEEATTEAAVYTIDFKQFAKDASTQDWWSTLAAAADDNTKYVGLYDGKHAWTETEQAAYDSMIAYQKANYDWYIDEAGTGLKTASSTKGIYLNCADNVTWGASFYSGQLNNSAAEYDFVLNVDKSGVYAMDMTA